MCSINRTMCLASLLLKFCNTVTFILKFPWKNLNFCYDHSAQRMNSANVFFHAFERMQALCRSAAQGQMMFGITVLTREYRALRRTPSKQNLPPICSEIDAPTVIQPIRGRYCLELVLEKVNFLFAQKIFSIISQNRNR